MPDPTTVVRQWSETIWNAGDLDQIDRFHPPVFDNEGKPNMPTEARAWHEGMRGTFPDIHYQINVHMSQKLFILFGTCCLLILCAGAGFRTPLSRHTAVAMPLRAQTTFNSSTIAVNKTLTVVYWQAPTVANPYLASGTKDRDAAALVLEPLANYNEVGELVPRLAATIPLTINNGLAADGSAITWTLRSGVRWSDDTPLTAADVVFTWEYCTEPTTGCAVTTYFENVAAVEAVDDLTVKITFVTTETYPYVPFVTADVPILQQAQFADCIGSAAQGCRAENSAPVGTGPFRVTEFRANDVVHYERNPFYRGAAPYFDNVIFVGGGDAAAAARAVLVTGEADYAWNLQVEPQILDEMEATGRGRLLSAFAGNVERLMVNQTNPDPSLGADRSVWKADGSNDHPFLTDPELVRALSLAIDRTMIAEELYGRGGEPTCNLIPGPAPLVSPNNDNCLTQDIPTAKQILDNLGWTDTNDDGIREKDGHALQLLYQTSTNSVRQRIQALIQQWWAEIGVATELRAVDAAVFFGGDPNSPDTLNKFYADVEMYTNGAQWIALETYLGQWQCSEIPLRPTFLNGNNIARWCSSDYDTTYATLRGTFDPVQRTTLVVELNDLVVQQGGMIPLVRRGAISARSHELLGVQMNAWDSELWNIGAWSRVEYSEFVYLPLINR